MLQNRLRNKITSREDELTSTIIGTMKYLPSELFWLLIRNSCFNNNNLPKYSGKIENIDFWPHWDAEKTTNKNYVEPDVFFSFEEFDLIIEVKPYDNSGQYKEQWKNQTQSYFNEYPNEKELFYISLGGNYDKINENITINDNKITINKCDWMSLLIEVSSTLTELKKIKIPLANNQSIIRILEDTVNGFNYFNYYNIKWFNQMRNFKVKTFNLNTNYE